MVQCLGSSEKVASPRYWRVSEEAAATGQGKEGMEAGVLKTRQRGLHQETE